MHKLPVWFTVRESYGLFFSEFPALMRAAWAPVILAIVLMAMGNQLASRPAPSPALIGALLIFAGGLANALAFVRWHRFVILGETGQDRPILTLGRAEWRYIVSWLVLALIISAVAATVGIVALCLALAAFSIWPQGSDDAGGSMVRLVGVLAVAGGLIVIALVYVRLVLIMPNAAIRGELGIRAMANATRANSWRILVIMLLTLLPALLVSAIPAILMADWSAATPQPITPLEAWASAVLGVLLQPLAVIAESIVYIRLVDLPRAQQAGQSFSTSRSRLD
ncbi:hypothetical protein [Rhodoligotrophos ferricapiens]|uniref:hypothetical protein n=1 Tax=Rhodoligotrophos ferricapiens TaxID=3069264 RepID=UPI00315DA8BB